MPWQATARALAQRVGLDPRYVRRMRWVAKGRAVRSNGATLSSNLRFVLLDPEPANFTYELTNEDELADWVERVTGSPRAAVARALDEVRSDTELAERLRRATSRRWLWTKPEPPYGKRAGWYAIARLARPRLIVETGVHDGLASLLLLRALERNQTEKQSGRLVSFDVNPAAGWLVGSHPLWDLRLQSARTGLPEVLSDHDLGLFIHDSLHTYENEAFELSTAAQHLAPGGVLVSDNAHATSALKDVCAEFGLANAVFVERPRHHFYPGGAVGAGWRA